MYRMMLQDVWYNIKARGKQNKNIKLCSLWQDFELFYAWAIEQGYMPGMSVRRRDITKGFFPDNCVVVPVNASIKVVQSTPTAVVYPVRLPDEVLTNRERKSHRHLLYKSWRNMMLACVEPKHPNYCHYGAKGIKVCADWQDFDTFHDWALNQGYEPGCKIYRLNRSKHFAPDNCAVAPAKSRQEIWDGKKLNLKLVADRLGVKYTTLRYHVSRGMKIFDAVKLLKSKTL